MGKVYLPSKSPWLAEFIGELTMFPAGKHDDQVDSFGLIGRMLDDMTPASRGLTKPTTTKQDYSAHRAQASDAWRTL